jgi:excisionase family DNA binding protein
MSAPERRYSPAGVVVPLRPESAPAGAMAALDGCPEMLTVVDLAKLLRMPQSTVRALCARGELPAQHIGRRWFVPRAHLLARWDG